MSNPQKYEPPEAVVGPAFTELLNRLARARVRTTAGIEMSEEERKIWDYGVSERKRVLEHTLFLVFGQWAVYRQVISRLQSRGTRIAYGLGAFVSSCYFLSARAKRVSHEMFATIATMATTAPLGNEARVVLAELEGPEGPYFRRICQQKGFSEDLASVMATLDAKDGVDPTSDHVHPQLRLRPRLPVPDHPQFDPRSNMSREKRDNKNNSPPVEVDFRPARVQQGRVRMATENVDADNDVAQIRQELRTVRARERKSQEVEPEEDLWGKPFDFRKAATGGFNDDMSNADQEEALEPRNAEAKPVLTPSQRRAAERQARRMRARNRAENIER